MLLTAHNLTYYADLMRALREAIAAGRLGDFASAGLLPPPLSEERKVG